MDIKDMMRSDFMECMTTGMLREKHCPKKQCINLSFVDGVCVEQFTVLPACDFHGNFGTKCIYVNDVTGEYKEKYILNNDTVLDYTGLTFERCAVMNSIVADMMDLPAHPKIGFIGNGRINFATAKWMPDASEFVIHGRKGNEGKNFDMFASLKKTTVDVDFSELNTCDIVFVCTNSYLEKDLISANELKCPKLVILDCGYTLNEDFRREYRLFSDYPEQLLAHWKYEFPFDKVPHQFMPITSNVLKASKKVAVYLHGCGISDLSMAKFMEMKNDQTAIK